MGDYHASGGVPVPHPSIGIGILFMIPSRFTESTSFQILYVASFALFPH